MLTRYRSTSIKSIDDLKNGKELKMGSWEIQIQERIATRDVPATSSTECVNCVQSPSPDHDVKTSCADENQPPNLPVTESCSTSEHRQQGQ
ncbi:hypothetical protein KIN20_020665 [Parelaphostrongylus tenuis]|uniref:Uncharacterized protein n=1 Tax=Parelaphostrongylus tenuis TaxID=148309 RepID=A0AAD5MRL4_PARTN|nr:hypothetical protein KIN20_020664 [Parelaphostrongylus tenuis]KAJ1361419.1 hypothetical protein KIN20_020665 [Parelaphostrongylus tenuis]